MRRFALAAAAALTLLTPSFAPAQYYGGDPNSLVDSWYRTYLRRPPDPNMVNWVSMLQQGNPPDVVLAAILGSDEYYAKAGGTAQGFITTLFNDVLGRPPSPGEVDFWVRRMYTEARTDVAHEILTQNPGVWIGSTTTVRPYAPPVRAVPGVVVTPGYRWERERHEDWERRHEFYDYRRPYYPYRHDEDHHRR